MTDATTRLNAALDGRYRVERELGRGGMAMVYLADDLRHVRKVALKVLKPELAAAVGAERFLTEIRTTARLHHPNILPLFDSGEADSLLFYTMPYVEGDTLSDRLSHGPQMRVDEAVRITTDVAEALQVAHEQGVIHRDIKPSNILLSRGRALVADFGIARVAALSETRLTRTGFSLGTVGYMSPEQAASEEDVDARSDIYSLGCVLFEMLAGQPPWGRGNLISILTKQATEPVPSLRVKRPDIPVALDRALATALAREPSHRFDSSAAFAVALSAARAEPATAAAGKTVLVLPFVNRSADPENEYFSDGLTEEVISDLAGIAALSVISRNSAMALKGTTLDTRTLASRHGVTHLVTGSVRKAGSSVRVTVELVEASTDQPLWSEKFDGTLDDVFRIQEEIASRIVSALELRLTAAERRGAAERPIENPVAYDCYLKARQLTYSWTEEAQHTALRLVDEAIRVAGETPLLLATKGQIRWNMVNSGVTPAEEGLPQALALAERALTLDPDHHVAIFVRGLVAATGGRIETALADLYRAHTMRPNDANILMEWIRWSMSAGLRNVERYARQVVRIDPLSPFSHLGYAHQGVMRGYRDEAPAALRRAVELSSSLRLHTISAWVMAEADQHEEAIEILDRVTAAPSNDPHRSLARFLASALRGDERKAMQLLATEDVQRLQSEWDFLALAGGCAILGRTAEGIAWVQRTIQVGHINHPFMSEHSHMLEPLRGEPAFTTLMHQVRPRWEAVVEWERKTGA